MANRTDRRVERSKQSLRDALIELILEKSFEATSVSEIAERANVGRSTFYIHYADKEDLLYDSIGQLEKQLVARSAVDIDDAGADYHPALAFSRPLLEHTNDARDLYRALVGRASGALLQKGVHDMLAELVRAGLADAGAPHARSEVPTEVVVEFVVGAFWSILSWWLEKPSPHSPQAIDAAFRELVLPGLRALERPAPCPAEN